MSSIGSFTTPILVWCLENGNLSPPLPHGDTGVSGHKFEWRTRLLKRDLTIKEWTFYPRYHEKTPTVPQVYSEGRNFWGDILNQISK